MGGPTSKSGGVDVVDLVEDGPDERRHARQIQWPRMGSVGHGWIQQAYLGFYFYFLFFPIDLSRRALGPSRLTLINNDLFFKAVGLLISIK